jgi:hypothetical protein
MTNAAEDSSGTSLRAAILHYFQWLSTTSAASTGAAATAATPPLGVDEGNTNKDHPNHSNRKGSKVLAALLEEFPELESITAPTPLLIPELKVRFETHPNANRKDPPESASTGTPAVVVSLKQPAATSNVTGRKRKDTPDSIDESQRNRKHPKSSSASNSVAAAAASASPISTSARVIPSNEPKKAVVSYSWEERYQQLQHYQKGYGHCRLPTSYNEVPGLGWWVHRQRSDYKENKLNPEKISKLEELKFQWALQDKPHKQWDERFEELVEFQRVYGQTRVPRSYKPDPSLGEWVHRQRANFRHKNATLMESDRLSKLQAIGFEFSLAQGHKSWDERFEQLVEFRRTHGHINVPQPKKRNTAGTGKKANAGEVRDQKQQYDDEDRFATWFSLQKAAYWKYKNGDRSALTHARFKKLDGIGVGKESEPPLPRDRSGSGHHRRDDVAWNLRLDQVRLYKQLHGDCNVPQHYRENKELGQWVKHQRKHYQQWQAGKQSSLTVDRRRALESIGFQWMVRTKTKEHFEYDG